MVLRQNEPTIHVKWRGNNAWSQPIKARPGFVHKVGFTFRDGSIRLFWDGKEQSIPEKTQRSVSDVQKSEEYAVFVGNDWREGMSIE